MEYFEFAGEKYATDEVVSFIASILIRIGVNSFDFIGLNPKKNRLLIELDCETDRRVLEAIHMSSQTGSQNNYESEDAVGFLLSLTEVANQFGDC